jgi:U32 family peptidase
MVKRELSACLANWRVFEKVRLKGLDAVYLGQPYCLKFDGNFLVDIGSLEEAIVRLHGAGKKAYLVTPAIPKGADVSTVKRALGASVKLGIDGIETHDAGVFRMARREYPKLPVHVGNLANVYNERTAAAWKSLGAARIVPNHELTLEELAIVCGTGGVEFERPIHGLLSLGMAYSCLLRRRPPSERLDPCRQQCDEPHYLELDGWRMRSVGTSLLTGEDYCLLEHLAGLAAVNLSAMRLETYFYSAEKINELIDIYRAAIDGLGSGRPIDGLSLQRVEELAPMGLCNGWHFGQSGRDYVSRQKTDGKIPIGEQSAPVG